MNEFEEENTYRDRPLILDSKGKRNWILARKPIGKWYTRRTIVGWGLLLFLILAPTFTINNHPFMQIDIVAKKFYLFGAVISPHDTFIMALLMAVTVVSIVLFTVVFGRIFCGWACPQTIFLELVYRKIEYLFEGNYRTKKKSGNKSLTRTIKNFSKHFIYIIISIFFTHVFLAWFIGYKEVLEVVSGPIYLHKVGFLFMLLISFFYYFIYSYLREQICTLFCPYGRLQGVLLDSKSISVIYDYKRGEPRGAKNSGDCIDCHSCIDVCPTGIDIKNGSQLECINCTACIDECNLVMAKLHKPKNLIRFDSVFGVETGKRSLINARTIAYSSVLAILFSVFIYTLASQTQTKSILLRVPGTMYQEVSNSEISNMYELKMVNKTSSNKTISLQLAEPNNGRIALINTIEIAPNAEYSGILQVILPKKSVINKHIKVSFHVYEGSEIIEEVSSNFIGPTQ